MTSLKNHHLVLFLTEGTRLTDWNAIGLLQREADLYRRLRPHLGSISWVTYGGTADLTFQEQLPDIDILVNRYRLPNQVYIQQLPWLHQKAFARATILKSEQTGASQAAIRVARHYGKRYIARSGFSLGLFVQYNPADYEENYEQIAALERESFATANQIVLTTEEMRQDALKTHTVDPEKIVVIPNYVNTERFHPEPTARDTEKPCIVFAGRFADQKNVINLLEAVAPLNNTQVEMIGSGELRPQVESTIASQQLAHVRLVGNVPNTQLHTYLQKATVYAQPSLYEGHPKTIFEAMACGAAVVVGDSPGIRQFVEHGKTGWLVQHDAESIRQGIQHLLANPDLRQALGNAARDYVVQELALKSVVEKELTLLEEISQLEALPTTPTPRPIMQSVITYLQRLIWLIQQQLRP